MTRIDDALARAEVYDGDGRAVPLQSLWRERPALLLWVRHFG